MDAESAGIVDIPLMEAINQVGDRAAQDKQLLLNATTKTEKLAVKYLQDIGLADDKRMLRPEALTAVTCISMPSFVENINTAYGKRSLLLHSGWRLATTGRQASMADQLLHPNQCRQYYGLLIEKQPFMQMQEESGWLSHCQGDHYYATLVIASET